MIDIGIDKGDLVLVKKTETANDGDVVVALPEEPSQNGLTKPKIECII